MTDWDDVDRAYDEACDALARLEELHRADPWNRPLEDYRNDLIQDAYYLRVSRDRARAALNAAFPDHIPDPDRVRPGYDSRLFDDGHADEWTTPRSAA